MFVLATLAKSKIALSWIEHMLVTYLMLATAFLVSTAIWAQALLLANYRLDAGSIKMMVKDQLVNTGRRKLGVVLGDNVKTGIKSLFMPGVKVGVNSWVGPNFMVERDLPANSMAFLKQQCDIGERKA